jgi:hypothetical protein
VQPWEGAVLRVGAARDIVKTTKVVMWVPTELLRGYKNSSLVEDPKCGA